MVVVLAALSVSHLLNDMIQSLIAAVYPILKDAYTLTFTQIGLITLAFQLTASLLQPLIGAVTDRRPQPYSLTVGMGATLAGLLLLSVAADFPTILAAAALVGVGSSVFHPEASRMARVASGGKHGFAQSLFQVGGNAGSALGPHLAAFVVVPRGQGRIAWFSVAAVLAMVVLFRVGRWYSAHLASRPAERAVPAGHALSRRRVAVSITILLCLVFSKHFYSEQLAEPYAMVGVNVFAADTDEGGARLFTPAQQQFLNLIRGTPGLLPPPVETMDGLWHPHERTHVARMTRCSAVGSPDGVKPRSSATLFSHVAPSRALPSPTGSPIPPATLAAHVPRHNPSRMKR